MDLNGGSKRVSTKDRVQDYLKGGRAGKKLTKEAQEAVDRLGADGVRAVRSSPRKPGRPSNVRTIVDGLTDDKLAAVADERKKAVFGAKHLTSAAFENAIYVALGPIIYLWDLPGVTDKKAKKFGNYAQMWAAVYIPEGIPLLDHIVMAGVFLDCLFDCFRRKRKGEEPYFGGEETDGPQKAKEES